MTTNNHPAHGPVSLDRLHQISEILSKVAAQSDGGNLGYAMADAVKVIDVAIAAFGAEPVAYMHRSGQVVTREECCDDKTFAICCKVETPLYTAPQPAPVVPDIDRRAIADKVYGKCCRIPGATFYNAAEFAIDEVESLRTAMLQSFDNSEQLDEVGSWNNHMNTPTANQAINTGELLKHIEGMEVSLDVSTCDADAGHRYFGTVTEISELETAKNGFILLVQDAKPNFKPAGNHTEQHLDMVVHSGDAKEKVDCRLPLDQWLSQQNEPIDVDCGCVTTEAFFHWLRVAYEAGNSPAAPDTWIPVSERMPEAHEPIYIFHPDYGVDEGVWYDNQEDAFLWDSDCSRCRAIETVSHWMPMPALPAAPQQGVK
ncbi:DUF551 domain-containing protein [Citrobacter freundii]|nr:DUF551 domain-containing protein [Citrobacter freundii]